MVDEIKLFNEVPATVKWEWDDTTISVEYIELAGQRLSDAQKDLFEVEAMDILEDIHSEEMELRFKSYRDEPIKSWLL